MLIGNQGGTKSFDELPEDALSLRIDMVGRYAGFEDGNVLVKTEPFTVIGQTLAGEQEVTVAGETVRVGPGDVFVVVAQTSMRIVHRDGPDGPPEASWLHLHTTLFGSIDLMRLLEVPRLIGGEHAAAIGETIQALVDLEGAGADYVPLGYIRARELAYRAVRLLCEVSPARENFAGLLHNAGRLTPVFDFVEAHLAEPLSVADLADCTNLSLSRFHVFFKQNMAESPMEYLRRARLERARQLLATSDRPVYAVAEAVGFPNQFHFSRVFRQHVGVSPGRYRRQVRGQRPPGTPDGYPYR